MYNIMHSVYGPLSSWTYAYRLHESAMPNVEALSNTNTLTTNSISRCIVVAFCGRPSLCTA